MHTPMCVTAPLRSPGRHPAALGSTLSAARWSAVKYLKYRAFSSSKRLSKQFTASPAYPLVCQHTAGTIHATSAQWLLRPRSARAALRDTVGSAARTRQVRLPRVAAV